MQSWVNVLYAVTIPISLLYELGTNRVQSPFAEKAANGFESMSWLFNAYDRCIGIVFAIIVVPVFAVLWFIERVCDWCDVPRL